MSDNPLVLYLADPPTDAERLSIQGALCQLRDRWPGAMLSGCDGKRWEAPIDGLARPWFVLGLGGRPQHAPMDATIIDPTPDASIAMQVWRLLHPGDDPCAGCPEDNCDGCEGRVPDQPPPTWLRYLDDAVCGRGNKDAQAFLAWVKSFAVPTEIIPAVMTYGPAELQLLVGEGRAILRARERWVADMQQGRFPASVWGTDEGLAAMVEELKGESNRLRAERDALLRDTCDDAVCGRQMYEMAGRSAALREDCDRIRGNLVHETAVRKDEQRRVAHLRAGLQSALEMATELQLAWEVGQNRHTDSEPHHCPDPICDEYIGPLSGPEHAEGCRYVALRKLVLGDP